LQACADELDETRGLALGALAGLRLLHLDERAPHVCPTTDTGDLGLGAHECALAGEAI
jgi:hypothetical protein